MCFNSNLNSTRYFCEIYHLFSKNKFIRNMINIILLLSFFCCYIYEQEHARKTIGYIVITFIYTLISLIKWFYLSLIYLLFLGFCLAIGSSGQVKQENKQKQLINYVSLSWFFGKCLFSIKLLILLIHWRFINPFYLYVISTFILYTARSERIYRNKLKVFLLSIIVCNFFIKLNS